MSTFFTSLFDTPTAPAYAARSFSPAFDVVESDDSFVVSADVPGVKSEDISVDVVDNVLTVSGSRSVSKTAPGRSERRSGSFRRSLRLPRGVEAGAIEAALTDGVLTLTVPKPAAIQPHRVQIAVGGETPAAELAA